MAGLATSIILSIVQYALEKGADFLFDLRKGKRAFEGKELNEYLEWCRRKDQAELVQEIAGARADIEKQLSELDLDVESIAARVSVSLEGDFADLKSKLARLENVLSPSAFSSLPMELHLSPRIPFLGREIDSDLLCKAEGDLIVTGQPGIGKTALLHQHASELGAEFLVTEDADIIRSALRVSCPHCVVVDDAGDKLALIRALLHARQELGAPFRLIAVCWPFETEQLQQCLRIGNDGVIELRLLPARVIATLVQEVGRRDRKEFLPWLLVEIRRQAAGRPGLAIRLAELVLEEGAEALADAGSHVALIDRAFSRIAEQGQVRPTLAAFAVGGQRGLRMKDVGEVLGHPLPTLTDQLRALRDGGVLETHSDGTISTIPSSLRHSLIKHRWLTGDALALESSYWLLFEKALDRHDALKTLLDSVRMGAIVQDQERLVEELQQDGSSDMWTRYAHLGEKQCREALSLHPDMLEHLAKPGLHYLPALTAHMLLDAAVGDERPENSCLGSPVRKLSDWVTQPGIGTKSACERRECLLDATLAWADQGGKVATCWRVLPKCVSLHIMDAHMDPVDDRKFTFLRGMIPEDELPAVSALWDRIVAFAQTQPPESWGSLVSELREWLRPGSIVPDIPLSASFDECVLEKARKVIADLNSVPSCPRNALARWVQVNADVLPELAEQLVPEEEFTAVFPADPSRAGQGYQDYRDQYDVCVERARKAGSAWATGRPDEIGSRLKGFAREVEAFGSRVWPDLRSTACASLASSVEDTAPWVEQFMAMGLDVECVGPLLQRAVQAGHPRAADWLALSLDQKLYQEYAAKIVLAHGDLPITVMDATANTLSEYPDLARCQAVLGEIDVRWLPRLSAHPSVDVLRSLVLGDFGSEAKPLLNADREQWLIMFRRGVSGISELNPSEFYHLDQILDEFPELAVEITAGLLRNAGLLFCEHNTNYAKLTAVLSVGDRIQLLPLLAGFLPGEFTSLLVGTDIRVYEALLQTPELKQHHLSPLMTRPFNDTWQAKARMAIDHGYSPGEVAASPFSSGWSFSGSAVGFWEGWRQEFAKLGASEDESLNRIGDAGIERCDFQISRATQAERHEEIYGINSDE
jgi:hypothetical protein